MKQKWKWTVRSIPKPLSKRIQIRNPNQRNVWKNDPFFDEKFGIG
jgi:hypothetical protein